jgi:hypothetical protein
MLLTVQELVKLEPAYKLEERTLHGKNVLCLTEDSEVLICTEFTEQVPFLGVQIAVIQRTISDPVQPESYYITAIFV